jgi:MFS transporter, PAT family, solute carrier family 33 (acetyl-CoA transportor), member 1
MSLPKSASFSLLEKEIILIKNHEESNLKGDFKNIILLLILYILQGIPQGLSNTIPILLQNRGVSYTDQAEFSIAFFPFASIFKSN